MITTYYCHSHISQPLLPSSKTKKSIVDKFAFRGLDETEEWVQAHLRVSRVHTFRSLLPAKYSDDELNLQLDQAIKGNIIGQGGVHIVYQAFSSYLKNQVFKVDVSHIRGLIRNEPLLDFSSAFIVSNMARQVERERKHTGEFYRHFQSDGIHVPPQKIYIGMVDLPPETL